MPDTWSISTQGGEMIEEAGKLGGTTDIAAPIAGVVPPEFIAEVVLAGGSDLTFSLWAMLVD